MIAELFEIMLNVVGPVVVCAGLGFGWAKRKQRFDKEMVAKLVLNIGVPCLVFSTIARVDLSPSDFYMMAGGAVLTTLAFLGVGWLILKALRLPARVYLNAVAFGNVGNMGLPLCLFAFGDQGLALAIAYFVINVLLATTVGVAIASGKYRLTDVLRQPFVYAAAGAVFFLLTGFEVPELLEKTTKLLGSFTIPLMLITLGVSLAELKITDAGRSFLISALRIGTGLVIGFAAAETLSLEGNARGVLVVMSSMPVAVFMYLLAEVYAKSGQAVAGAVVMSTVMSFVTLPVLIWYLTY